MTEFELIRRLLEHIPGARTDVVLGAGDDAACLRPPPGRELVVSTDTLVAGVHFTPDVDPRALGHKALAVNLSDLAAMGAEPAWATLALTLPEADPAWVDGFAAGFGALAAEHGVALVGGDTTRGPLAVGVTVIGSIEPGRALRRDRAVPGDWICVSGALGEAGWWLTERRAGREPPPGNALDWPQPRVALGRALAGLAHAAIDVSDGLIADLGHILEASGVGASVYLDGLPLGAPLRAQPDRAAMLQLALTAGDDYELCFTVAEVDMARLDALQRRLGLPLSPIGRIEAKPGLRLLSEHAGALRIEAGGYDHFGRSG
ncbi:MAG: thiamine-monophosphate kinase [Gammaproteobacteria bacterium]|nr:MAG: thiamine-monophosphate kinase [Gammaproteobacteria bacterium]